MVSIDGWIGMYALAGDRCRVWGSDGTALIRNQSFLEFISLEKDRQLQILPQVRTKARKDAQGQSRKVVSFMAR